MTTLTKYWVLANAIHNEHGLNAPQAVHAETIYLASDVDALVEKYEVELRESKAREVPLPSKHYTDEIIALRRSLDRVIEGQEALKEQTVRIRNAALGDGHARPLVDTEDIVRELRIELARVTTELNRYADPVDEFKKRMTEKQPHDWEEKFMDCDERVPIDSDDMS